MVELLVLSKLERWRRTRGAVMGMGGGLRFAGEGLRCWRGIEKLRISSALSTNAEPNSPERVAASEAALQAARYEQATSSSAFAESAPFPPSQLLLLRSHRPTAERLAPPPSAEAVSHPSSTILHPSPPPLRCQRLRNRSTEAQPLPYSLSAQNARLAPSAS